MIELLFVGGSHDGRLITVDDRVDYVELIDRTAPPMPRWNVADADKPTPNLTFNIEKYHVNRYRGIATLC